MGGAQTPLGRDGRRPHESTRAGDEQAKYRRRFKPRTCRICFETVLPTFDFARFAPDGPDFDGVHDPHDNFGEDNANLVGIGAAVGAVGEAAAGLRDRVRGAVASALPPLFQRSRMPRVRYVSENPADGRLISPCHCKGSQKYVHEGCLQAWRHAQPLAERNYWKCPTCGFEYRMQRLRWGRIVSNKAVRGLLTLLVFLATLFVLGFIADPLMDLWTDPVGMLVDTFVGLDDLDLDDATKRRLHDVLGNTQASGAAVADAAASTWWGHLFKGFLSLGIVGVVKTFLVVSPFTWWNLRGTGFGRARRRAGGGRAQFESTGWIFIIVGAFTFLGVSCDVFLGQHCHCSGTKRTDTPSRLHGSSSVT